MAEDKKQDSNNSNKQLNESVDFRESSLSRQIKNNDTTTVSQRVPITPTPTRPPDRDKND